jgi:hypothetical protein
MRANQITEHNDISYSRTGKAAFWTCHNTTVSRTATHNFSDNWNVGLWDKFLAHGIRPTVGKIRFPENCGMKSVIICRSIGFCFLPPPPFSSPDTFKARQFTTAARLNYDKSAHTGLRSL